MSRRRLPTAAARYDAILLDVDNGPDALTREANDRIYSPAGLAVAKAALTRGGILAIWSAAPDERFSAAAGFGGLSASTRSGFARGATARGARHTIWFAQAG